MDVKVKKFIENHIDLIEREDWEELYNLTFKVNLNFVDTIDLTQLLKQVATDIEAFNAARKHVLSNMLFEAVKIAKPQVYDRNKFIWTYLSNTCGFLMSEVEELLHAYRSSRMQLVIDPAEHISHIRIT